jgi:transposase
MVRQVRPGRAATAADRAAREHGSIRVRRAMIIMASSSGIPAPAIARLVAADEDTVRDVIHAFNQNGLAALDLGPRRKPAISPARRSRPGITWPR